MKAELLDLVPTEYLCPFCGQWHPWRHTRELGFYDRLGIETSHCPNLSPEEKKFQNCFYSLGFKEDYVFGWILGLCLTSNVGPCKVRISDIFSDPNQPIILFDMDIELPKCRNCYTFNFNGKECPIHYGMYGGLIKFGFKFKESEYFKIVKRRNKKENTVDVQPKEQFDEEELKEETMNENELTTKFELGMNKDKNIASTLMGIAVRKGDGWVVYDKKKHKLIDVGKLKLGDLPIFIVPTMKLKEGDLIKDGGRYYVVQKIEKGNVQTLDVKTGEVKIVVPIDNLLGLKFYSKVIAVSIDGKLGMGKMAAIVAMSKNSNNEDNQANSLLPLVLLKDELDIEDDMKKMLVMSTMMGADGQVNGNMNGLLPLLLCKDEHNIDDDTRNLVLMSTMMGATGADGQANGNMNGLLPFMLCKDEFNIDDDTRNLVLMSTMMGAGGQANGNMNGILPFMLYKDELNIDDDMRNLVLMSTMMGAGGQANGNMNTLLPFMLLKDKSDKKDTEEKEEVTTNS